MLSSTSYYALRSVCYLARFEDKNVSRSEIASATLVPADYLLKVLNALDAAGIVAARRGPGGGYRLAEPADELTVLRVVSAIETIPRIETCPLGFAKSGQLCPLHELIDRANALVEELFAERTIGDLVRQEMRKGTCKFPNSGKKPPRSN